MFNNMGWKTITGTGLLALGTFLPSLGVDPTICTALQAGGTALGGIGLRAAIAKQTK